MDNVSILVTFLAGIVLALLHFGGLWWTIGVHFPERKGLSRFLGSFFLRLALVVVFMEWVCGDSLIFWLVCLSGFIVARTGILFLATWGHREIKSVNT